MSNEATVAAPTQEEEATKIANECQEAAHIAFITQMKLMGKTDDEVKSAFATYREVQVKRASRYNDMVAAVLGSKEGEAEAK